MGRRRRRRTAGGRRRSALLLFLALGGAAAVVAGVAHLGPMLREAPAPSLDDPARALEVEPPAPWDRVRVEVLNAGGVQGMAARATAHLREAGFDVVYYGNADAFDREATAVLDRTGEEGAAASVARVLGVSEVEEARDSAPLVDVTVLLGRSWRPPGPADEGGAEGWFDLDRLLDRILRR